jgi:hypothetical protein
MRMSHLMMASWKGQAMTMSSKAQPQPFAIFSQFLRA